MNPKIICFKFLIIIVSVIVYSCNKAGNPADNNIQENIPVQRIYYKDFEDKISEQEKSIVNELFDANDLSYLNLQINSFRQNPDSLVEYYVNGRENAGSVRIFNSDIWLLFDNQEKLCNQTGALIKVLAVLYPIKLTKEQAGQLFYDKIASDKVNNDSLQSYKSKGFNAEYGYYAVPVNGSDTCKSAVGEPCWRLTVVNNGEYPNALIRADNSQIVYYAGKAPIH